jgi:m7GpppX diphosphatase
VNVCTHRDQLKIFVHHLPSFFHLHVHFCSIYADARQSQVTRAHLVEDIIDALQLQEATDADEPYAAKSSITYILGEKHPLYKALTAHGSE